MQNGQVSLERDAAGRCWRAWGERLMVYAWLPLPPRLLGVLAAGQLALRH